MKIDVFISYHTDSSRDVVGSVVERLESLGVRCWYAPRDVEGNYAGSIARAIEDCSVFLLMLNKPASESRHVLNEIDIAFSRSDIHIIPFHIADDKNDMSADTKYYIGRMHWVDGRNGDFSECLEDLAERIFRALGRTIPTVEKTEKTKTAKKPKNPKKKLEKRIIEDAEEILETILDKNSETYICEQISEDGIPEMSEISEPPGLPTPVDIITVEEGESDTSDVSSEHHESIETESEIPFFEESEEKTEKASGFAGAEKLFKSKPFIIGAIIAVFIIIPFLIHACVGAKSLEYELGEDGGYIVVGIGDYSGSSEINIPEYYNDKKVTGIGDHAFYFNKTLKTVHIEKGIKNIGISAFADCDSLTSVTIPDSVESIGNAAFDSCTSLKSISIPGSVKNIGDRAFEYCKALTDITISDGVENIGEETFADCTSLKNIYVSNTLINIGNRAFVRCSSLVSITIPDGVKSIAGGLFYDCNNLKSVVVPEGVTTIGFDAFYDCKSLESIAIPKGVVSIGENAFFGCYLLDGITIPDGVESIGEGAFFLCKSLTSLNIPDSVTCIEGGSFSVCESLTNITIPENVESIGPFAFADCDSLTSITIPNNVLNIGESVFLDCALLTDIYCEAESKPEGWDDEWLKDCGAHVHWGEK